MIRFACPACHKAYELAYEFPGRTTKCRACKPALRVPAAPVPVPVQSLAPTAFPMAQTVPRPGPLPTATPVVLVRERCEWCDEPVHGSGWGRQRCATVF